MRARALFVPRSGHTASVSYMIEQGICYLTLADKGYPKRLAFLYLEEIHQEFVGELRNDYGEEWRNKVGGVEQRAFLLGVCWGVFAAPEWWIDGCMR